MFTVEIIQTDENTEIFDIVYNEKYTQHKSKDIMKFRGDRDKYDPTKQKMTLKNTKKYFDIS